MTSKNTNRQTTCGEKYWFFGKFCVRTNCPLEKCKQIVKWSQIAEGWDIMIEQVFHVKFTFEKSKAAQIWNQFEDNLFKGGYISLTRSLEQRLAKKQGGQKRFSTNCEYSQLDVHWP